MNQPKTHPLGTISSLCGSCLNQRNFECPIAESTAAHVQSYQTNTPAFLKILNTIVLGFQIIFLPYILCHKHTTWTGEYGKMEIHRKMLSIYVNRLYISILSSGPLFNIKMSSYQYGKCHCGEKTVVRSSYLHNGISYTGKMTSLYWFSPLIVK